MLPCRRTYIVCLCVSMSLYIYSMSLCLYVSMSLYIYIGCTFIHEYRMYIYTCIQDVHLYMHTGCTFTHTYRMYIHTYIQDVHSHIHTGFTFIHANRMRNSSQYIYTCIQDEKHLHTPMAALGQRYRHSPRETRAPVCLRIGCRADSTGYWV